MDDAFAARTAYRGRIAHGLLSASFGSAVVGTILPGAGAIYLSQTLAFHRPVRIGDIVLSRITVAAVDETTARVVLRGEAFVGEDLIMDGEATVRVPRRRRVPKSRGAAKASRGRSPGLNAEVTTRAILRFKAAGIDRPFAPWRKGRRRAAQSARRWRLFQTRMFVVRSP
jgi:hypothetical protein